MPRPEKVALVDEIREKLVSSPAAVITEYRGLSVSDLARLREALAPTGTRYKVYKNTLARRAAEAAELPELTPLLEGPVAFAFVEGDVVGAAKALRDFSRTNDHLVIKGGLLEQRLLTAEEVVRLATLPTREQLLAMTAGAFKAPLVKAAGLFSAVPRKLAYAVKALIDKRTEAGEAEPAPGEDAAVERPVPAEPAASGDAAVAAAEEVPPEEPVSGTGEGDD